MFVSDHQAWKLVHAWKIEASYMVPEDLGFVMECMWSFFWIDLSLFFEPANDIYQGLFNSRRIHLVFLEKGNGFGENFSLLVQKAYDM